MYDARMAGVFESVGIGLNGLCFEVACADRIDALAGSERRWFAKEADRWLRQISKIHRFEDSRAGRLILVKTANLRLVGEPMYYLKHNKQIGK